MAARLPPPSTMVVLSLSMTIFFAVPRSSIWMFSSLIPRSSVIERPLVRVAISSSIALRRSPKPGAFTAAACSVPRSLFTTSVASASHSASVNKCTRIIAVKKIFTLVFTLTVIQYLGGVAVTAQSKGQGLGPRVEQGNTNHVDRDRDRDKAEQQRDHEAKEENFEDRID